jgi:hypothetical protein
MYNENVLKWCGSLYSEDIDLLVDEQEDAIVIYDDSQEWYNIDESEADV